MEILPSIPAVQPEPSNGITESAEFGTELNDFLLLLTAQIQNQDPLSPLDSTQFVEQLATFSTLEQQVQSNSSLENIATTLGDLHTLIATDWLGQDVSIDASFLPFQNQPITFEFDQPENVDRAELVIRDRSGELVFIDRIDLDQSQHTWSGEHTASEQIPNDTLLQFSVEFFNNGQFAGTATPRALATITDVANENGEFRFGTDLQVSTGISDVQRTE